MDVRPLDVADPEQVACYHDVCRRAELFERPWESIWSLPELRARLTHPDVGQRSEFYAVFDGEALVGGGFADFPLHDNTDKTYFHVMVAPEHRRRGVGSLLVEHIANVSRGDGRTMLLGESSVPFEERDTHGYRRFAERVGFKESNTEVLRILELPVDRELLRELVRDSAPHHTGYRIDTFCGVIPEQYLASYCRAHNQLVTDAPSGEVDFEEEAMTPESFRQAERRMAAGGQSRLSTVAVAETGEVVGYTDLVVKADPAERVMQWGTLVQRAHRGHRLGTALKAANLLALQERFPDRTAVVTANAELNQNMVGINDRLGFRPVAVIPGFRRDL